MADIPKINYTAGQATSAPIAAQLTLDPLVDAVNLLNDSTIPAIQTTQSTQTGNISSLNGSVSTINGEITALQATQSSHSTSIATINGEITTLNSEVVTINSSLATLEAEVAALVGGPFIVPQSYGTWDQTGNTDVSGVLQLACNAAASLRLPLMIPPGTYLIANTVQLTNLMNQTQSLIMIGVGPQPGSANTLPNSGRNPFTVFNSTIVNGPMFEMTGGFNCWFENFVGVGPNKIPQFMFPNFDGANYVNSGIRDSQYSPCSGFSVDGLNSAVPSDGGWGSNVAAGGSITAQYSASHSPSSNCMFRNVSMCNFVVNWAITLSGAGSLSDQFTFDRCNSTIAKVAYASCQAQSKIHRIIGGNWGSCQTLFDGSSYGLGQGIAPIDISGINIGNCLRIFNFSEQYAPFTFHDCYGESFRSLGVYGTSAAASRSYLSLHRLPATFFTGNAQGYPGPIPPPPFILETQAATRVESLSFGINNGNVSSWNFAQYTGTGTSPLVFSNCLFKSPPISGFMPLVAPNSTYGSVATLDNCNSNGTFPPFAMSDYSAGDIAQFTQNGVAQVGPRAARYSNGTGFIEVVTASASCTLTCAVTALTIQTTSVTFASAPGAGSNTTPLSGNFSGQTGIYNVAFSNGDVRQTILTGGGTAANWLNRPLSGTATTAATVQCTSLTFTAGDPTLFLVGDLLYWQMIAQGGSTLKNSTVGWAVSNISGSTITCLPTCDATQYDIVANQPSTTSVYMPQYVWFPSGAAITATSSTSTSLTAVSATGIKNGFWLKDTGGFLAANSRVASGGGTGTLTLNKATTGSGSTTLYFARAEAPALAAVW